MSIHDYVLYLSLTLMLLLLLVFVYVAKHSTEKQAYKPIQTKAYKFRVQFFWILIALGIFVSYSTLSDTPYAAYKNHAAATNIDVVGHQWFWKVSQDTVEVGIPVVFNVSSADVTHGLGIYNADLKLIVQTQAMPGYTNKLKHTFNESGKYKFLCLEYCGLAHHRMEFEFNVVAKSQE